MQSTSDSKFGTVLRYNVRRLCDERGITEVKLYSSAGFTRSGWMQLFKSRNGPTLRSIDRVALALGVHISELLRPQTGGTIEPTSNTA